MQMAYVYDLFNAKFVLFCGKFKLYRIPKEKDAESKKVKEDGVP